MSISFAPDSTGTKVDIKIGSVVVATLSQSGLALTQDASGSNQVVSLQQMLSYVVPVSAVMPFASASPPAGWLKCNGQAVSRTAYPALFAAIGTVFGAGNGSTTFNVPDLRGEFIRGWDDGRGVDNGRGFGSWQADNLGAHRHYTLRNAVSDNRQQYNVTVNGGNTLAAVGSSGYETYILNGHSAEADSGLTSWAGAQDTRPRSLALLYCIKT